MKITIDIDDAKLGEEIINEIAKESVKSWFRNYERGGIEKAVKEVIYSQKEELIQRCVDRASAELTRKALPKILEKMVK